MHLPRNIYVPSLPPWMRMCLLSMSSPSLSNPFIQLILDGILVGDLELDLLGLISMSIPDGARLVGRGVERDLDLNLTLCAKDVDPLVRRQLRRAGERRSAASEVQYTRGEAIGLELGIVLDYAEDAPGFSAKEKTRRRNRIASDVQHSSASKVAPIAHVIRISEVV